VRVKGDQGAGKRIMDAGLGKERSILIPHHSERGAVSGEEVVELGESHVSIWKSRKDEGMQV